jgi:hypothetical protein
MSAAQEASRSTRPIARRGDVDEQPSQQPLFPVFDGTKFYTYNVGAPSVSIITPGAWTVTTVTSGFTSPSGITFDGNNVWISEGFGSIKKIDSNAAVLQTVTVGSFPQAPAFDGGNLWVPNFNDSTVSIVRASTGAVLATLTGNGLDHPSNATFDGERRRDSPVGGTVSCGRRRTTSIGSLTVGSQPHGVCSDGSA